MRRIMAGRDRKPAWIAGKAETVSRMAQGEGLGEEEAMAVVMIGRWRR